MVNKTCFLDLLRREGMLTARKAIKKWPWSMVDRLAVETNILDSGLYGSICNQIDEETAE